MQGMRESSLHYYLLLLLLGSITRVCRTLQSGPLCGCVRLGHGRFAATIGNFIGSTCDCVAVVVCVLVCAVSELLSWLGVVGGSGHVCVSVCV